MWILRHAFAIAILPVTVVILVPLWICRRYGVDWRIPATASDWAFAAVAVVFLILGATLFVSTLYLFATRGRGTLAPWDPPAHLVIRGPYRFVRNPMISGVFFIVVSESLFLRSLPHAAWAAIFLLINLIYIPLLEEPQLEQRFGDEYRQYKRDVPRFLPASEERGLVVALGYTALLASLVITTLPGLVEMTRRAIGLQKLSYEQRRAEVNGPLYSATQTLLKTVSAHEPLALITNPDPKNIGVAILADYHLYPHPVKLYFRRSIYDADKSPARPVAIAYADIAHSPALRRATFAGIRAIEIGDAFVVRDPVPNAEGQSIIVPLVASADGPPPDVYTTEGVVENRSMEATRVAFEMFPSRLRREITLQPRQRLRWNDVAVQLFGAGGVGWMTVHAERPIGFQFWFVNLGRKQATPLMSFASGTKRASVLCPPGAKLWILNPNERDFWVTVNGVRRGVPFFSLSGEPATGFLNLSSEFPIVAYASWRDSTGRTLFAWPENRR